MSRRDDPEPRDAPPCDVEPDKPRGADAEPHGDDLLEGGGLPFDKLSGGSRLENEEREDRWMKTFFRDPAKVNISSFV